MTGSHEWSECWGWWTALHPAVRCGHNRSYSWNESAVRCWSRCSPVSPPPSWLPRPSSRAPACYRNAVQRTELCRLVSEVNSRVECQHTAHSNSDSGVSIRSQSYTHIATINQSISHFNQFNVLLGVNCVTDSYQKRTQELTEGCCIDKKLQGRIQEFGLGDVPLFSFLSSLPLLSAFLSIPSFHFLFPFSFLPVPLEVGPRVC